MGLPTQLSWDDWYALREDEVAAVPMGCCELKVSRNISSESAVPW